jgi:competence protein ComGC
MIKQLFNKKNSKKCSSKRAFSLIELGIVVLVIGLVLVVVTKSTKRMIAGAKCSGQIENGGNIDYEQSASSSYAAIKEIDNDKAFKDCIATEMGLLVKSECGDVATVGSSGSYLINGENIYCDMITDGGGWALIAVFSNNDGTRNNWTSVSQWQGDAAFGDATLVQKVDAKSPGYLSIIGTEVMIVEDIAGSEGKMKYNLVAPFNTQAASDWFAGFGAGLTSLPAGTTLTEAGTEIGSATTGPHWAFSKQATELVMKQLSASSGGGDDGAMITNNPPRGIAAQPGVGYFIDGSFTSGYAAASNVFKDDGSPHYQDVTLANHTVWLYVR